MEKCFYVVFSHSEKADSNSSDNGEDDASTDGDGEIDDLKDGSIKKNQIQGLTNVSFTSFPLMMLLVIALTKSNKRI